MELGCLIAVPSLALTDNSLTPTEKTVYTLLVGYTSSKGYNKVTNKQLAIDLRYRDGGVVKQYSEEQVQKFLNNLTTQGYLHQEVMEDERVLIVNLQKKEIKIQVETKPPTPKKVANTEGAKQVLTYLSQASITRGYRKMGYKETKTSLEPIQARLGDGYTVEQCIAVINIKFEDQFFKTNPKYLVPQTLFRPSNFEKYINECHAVKGIENKVVTKFGLANKSVGLSVDSEEETF